MYWIHEWILLLILLAMLAALLWLLNRTRLGVIVRERIADRPRRRLFVASVSFFFDLRHRAGHGVCHPS